jgi:hypothetical protein
MDGGPVTRSVGTSTDIETAKGPEAVPDGDGFTARMVQRASRPASKASLLLANPTISLTAATTFIPVNANRTSMSPWLLDDTNREQVGLPVIRDFDLNPMRDLTGWNRQGAPPPGPAITDPELKLMTATVTPNGYPPLGPIQVIVSYPQDEVIVGEGRI